MARPEKINPQTVDVICKALEMGAKRDAAAHVAGIHVATLYAWISRGKEESEGLYHELSERIKKILSNVSKRIRTRWHWQDQACPIELNTLSLLMFCE